ncbi:MAG: hypothetical protein KGL42_16085 [Betaproteobacteria bacterium]|nr:hypothetical protein [Betaproteobacteria bacterium]
MHPFSDTRRRHAALECAASNTAGRLHHRHPASRVGSGTDAREQSTRLERNQVPAIENGSSAQHVRCGLAP